MESEFRSGQFSNIEIAKQHGCSEGFVRKSAKKYGWQKDLSERVRAAVRTKVVRDAVRADHPGVALSDEQIIDEAATRAAKVVGRHERVAGQGAEGAEMLVRRALVWLADAEKSEQPKTQIARLRALAEIMRLTELLTAAMGILSKAATIERQALNIDAAPGDGDVNQTLVIHGGLPDPEPAGA
jgi:hypothetical protein